MIRTTWRQNYSNYILLWLTWKPSKCNYPSSISTLQLYSDSVYLLLDSQYGLINPATVRSFLMFHYAHLKQQSNVLQMVAHLSRSSQINNIISELSERSSDYKYIHDLLLFRKWRKISRNSKFVFICMARLVLDVIQVTMQAQNAFDKPEEFKELLGNLKGFFNINMHEHL